MYPQTKIEINDQSKYTPITIASSKYAPTNMAGFLADRGTEEVGVWTGQEWYNMFGKNIDVKKYGQGIKQCADVIDRGGSIFGKRLVASNATLPNLGVYVQLSVSIIPDTDPVQRQVTLRYKSLAIDTNSTDMDKAITLFEAGVPASDSAAGIFNIPLFIVTAKGRGSYAPRFKITPDYRFSRAAGFGKYLIEIIDPKGDTQYDESIYFSMNPDKIEKNKNISLDMSVERYSNLISVSLVEDNIKFMWNTMETALGLAEDELANMDFIFGKDLRGESLDNIIVDFSEFNLSEAFGNQLLNGSDGDFAEYPLESSEYEDQLLKLFNGSASESIYNLDSVAIDFVIDANYPDKVKRAIEEFVSYRQDCFYMRDLGLDVEGIVEVEVKEKNVLHNYLSGSYCNSMEVLDPSTKRYIHVTIMYLITPLLVSHFINGCARPFAGLKYGVYWIIGADIRKNSINFIPRVTPYVDEKQTLDDLGVNYVSIYNGTRAVLETFYTAQHSVSNTSFDYSYNVWAVQSVIKTLRKECPKSRYSFLRGSDFTDYQNDIERVLDKHRSQFLSFTFQYLGDAQYEAQNIYYAGISVQCMPVGQAEWFKITVLPLN